MSHSSICVSQPPASIRLNVFAGATEKMPAAQDDYEWADLVRELEALANDERPSKKQLLAITFGTLADNERSKHGAGSPEAPYNLDANYVNHTALAIDVDQCAIDDARECLARHGLAAIVYASASDPNPDGSRRVRVIAPLSRPLQPADVKHARLAFAEALGIGPGQGVETALAISQFMFCGRVAGTPARQVWVTEGHPIDADALVAAPLREPWRVATTHKTRAVVALDRVAVEDPDERTELLLAALADHWEAIGDTGHRALLRALAGYLARRGWSDEQIAAVVRGLAPDRPVTSRVAVALECARDARANPSRAAGWNALVAWSLEAAAVIEAVAKDPIEPDGWTSVCWSPWWSRFLARRATRGPLPSSGTPAEVLGKAATDDAHVRLPEQQNGEAPLESTHDEQRTDLGNARRLVRGYGDSLRYFEARKLWYVWDGSRWKADNTGEVVRAAKDAAESLWTEAKSIDDDDKRKSALAWAAKCQDRQRLMNMIELAKSEPGIPVVAADLDAHPWLLNVQNGTLDLRTGKLNEPDPALLMTKCCATHYDPNARSQLWEAFVKRTTGGDAELAAYIQRSLGYALFGAWREKAFWFGYGPPDGAKSTLLGVIGDVLGDYHVAAAASTWMVQNNVGGNRGDVTRLLGARFVTSLEIRPGLRFDEELVKKVTGGDTIVAAGKYENEIQFPPTFALWMGANDRPTIRDDDEGMWSRMRCVPFTNPVPDAEKDPHLREKLTSEEHAPAVLAWLVAGCRAWQREGVGKCTAVTAATRAYRADMNRAGAFFEECCELGEGYETTAKDMRDAYDKWCRDNAVRLPLSAKALGQRLRDLGAAGGNDESRRVIKPAVKAIGKKFEAQPAVVDRVWFGVRLVPSV